MRIAILDDHKEFCELLKSKIETIVPEDIRPLFIDIFHEPVSFLEAYNRETYDILFLDMNLNGKSGLEVGKHTLYDNTQLFIIILSAFDYRYESYEINPIQYLDKPINEERLSETVLRAVSLCQKRFYLFKTYNEQIPIEIKKIIYIESSYDQLIIHTKERDYIGAKRSNIDNLKNMYLPSFYQLDRSHYINMMHIKQIDGMWITMSNDEMIEIPRLKRKMFKENYICFLEKGIASL